MLHIGPPIHYMFLNVCMVNDRLRSAMVQGFRTCALNSLCLTSRHSSLSPFFMIFVPALWHRQRLKPSYCEAHTFSRLFIQCLFPILSYNFNGNYSLMCEFEFVRESWTSHFEWEYYGGWANIQYFKILNYILKIFHKLSPICPLIVAVVTLG